MSNPGLRIEEKTADDETHTSGTPSARLTGSRIELYIRDPVKPAVVSDFRNWTADSIDKIGQFMKRERSVLNLAPDETLTVLRLPKSADSTTTTVGPGGTESPFRGWGEQYFIRSSDRSTEIIETEAMVILQWIGAVLFQHQKAHYSGALDRFFDNPWVKTLIILITICLQLLLMSRLIYSEFGV